MERATYLLKPAMPLLYEQFEEEVRCRLLGPKAVDELWRQLPASVPRLEAFRALEAVVHCALDSTLPTLEEGER